MQPFTIQDPDYKQRVQDSFSRQGFMTFIGAQITAVEPGYCEIQVARTPQLTQQHGFFHAGVIGTIVDNAGGYAAYTLMDAESSVLTVEYKINFIAPGQGELLIGRGRVIRAGKKLTLSRCDAFVVSNGHEKHCAASQMTLMGLPNYKNKS